MKPGQTVSISGYDLLFDGMSMRQGPNYRDLVVSRSAVAAMSSGDEAHLPVALEHPHRSRAHGAWLESALRLAGDASAAGTRAVCVYHKPLLLLIWLGTIVMVIGGTLSLTDRRLRVGAPKPARTKAKPAMRLAE